MPPDLRCDPRHRVAAEPRRVVAEHLDRERRVGLGHRVAQVAQEPPRPAAQVEHGAGADLARLVRRRAQRVEAVGEHAEHRQIVRRLGALVDRLGRLPHAPLHRAGGEHLDQGRPRLGVAAVVQRDQQRAQAQPRRRERRRDRGGERLAPRELALGRGLVGQPARRHRVAQPIDRHRARRRVVVVIIVIVIVVVAVGLERQIAIAPAIGRRLAAPRLRIVLREVAHDQRAQRRVARVDRALQVAERQHRARTTVPER